MNNYTPPLEYSIPNPQRDKRCATKYLEGSSCNEKDCEGNELCLDYVPMWFNSCTMLEAINEMRRLDDLREQRKKNRGLESLQ